MNYSIEVICAHSFEPDNLISQLYHQIMFIGESTIKYELFMVYADQSALRKSNTQRNAALSFLS